MIIVQLSGGFGNQLFQYAAGLSLAEFHKVEIKVDVSLLEKKDVVTGTYREMDIFKLKIPPKRASEDDIKVFHSSSALRQFLEKLKPFYRRKIYKESSNMFDKNFFKAGNEVFIKGNRQSEHYFQSIKNKICKEYCVSQKEIKEVKAYGDKLSQVNSIAIHIRRGDYLTPVALEWLGLQPISYYANAMEVMTEKLNNSRFYIFSDDIDWCKENLPKNHDYEFVSGIVTSNGLEDFHLMSQCRHNIIANSTFSWWAAWLNQHPEKIVIAPQKWYNKPGLDTTDLIPAGWLRI